MEMHNPAHPGAVLKEWLADISVTAAAERLGVSRLSLSKVLNENGGISPDMDLRLSKALGTSQGFWYRMQAQWDMAQAKRRFKAKVKPIPRAELQSETTA
jgi:addiction module HigA family antidote